jgi:UPF0755 protein
MNKLLFITLLTVLFFSTAQAKTDYYPKKYLAQAQKLGLTMNEVITMASIIEMETSGSDHKKISAVIHNRLRQNMKLQMCSTVMFAQGTRKKRLLTSDLRYDSVYNTYRYKGLPPGPICSPSTTSIEAALWPDKNKKILYFTADMKGNNIFTETYQQHEKATNKIKQSEVKK